MTLAVIPECRNQKVQARQHILDARRYSTGQIIGQTDLDPYMTNMYGFPYWLVLRADLQRALYHGATKAGAQVHFARAVSAVLDDEQAQPRLTLGDGEEFSADIIIGADRARSRCHKSMFPDSVLDPIPTDSVSMLSSSSACRVFDLGQTIKQAFPLLWSSPCEEC